MGGSGAEDAVRPVGAGAASVDCRGGRGVSAEADGRMGVGTIGGAGASAAVAGSAETGDGAWAAC